MFTLLMFVAGFIVGGAVAQRRVENDLRAVFVRLTPETMRAVMRETGVTDER